MASRWRAFLARLDADHAEQEARWASRRADLAALPPPPPPEPYRDTRTPQQKVDGARLVVRTEIQMLREAQAELRVKGGTP